MVIQPTQANDEDGARGRPLLPRLLGRGLHVGRLHEALSNGHLAPLAQLILNSEVIAERAALPWLYKSLAHFGEEKFVCGGHDWWAEEDDPRWFTFAEKEFSESVCLQLSLMDEGLQLFVVKHGAYQPARPGDSAYDFVRRLCDENAILSLQFTKAPKWAEELFIYRPNLDAHSLVWGDHSHLSDPFREEALNAKCEAVGRVTQRLQAVAPPVYEDVPKDALNREQKEAIAADLRRKIDWLQAQRLEKIQRFAYEQPEKFYRDVFETVAGITTDGVLHDLVEAELQRQEGRELYFAPLAKWCLMKMNGESADSGDSKYVSLSAFALGEFAPTFTYMRRDTLRDLYAPAFLHEIFDDFERELAAAVDRVAYLISHGVPLFRFQDGADPQLFIEPNSLYVHLEMRGRLWDGPDRIAHLPDWMRDLVFDRSHLAAYDLMFGGLGESSREQQDALREAFRARIGLPTRQCESALAERVGRPAPSKLLVSSRATNMVVLAEDLLALGAIDVHEGLDFIWKMICSDESIKLYELGGGLPSQIHGAANDTRIADMTLLQEEADQEGLRLLGFDPVDADCIRQAFRSASGHLPASASGAVPVAAAALPPYLDAQHPRFSVKLAASIKAWLAMEDGKLMRGKRPLTAMEEWLQKNFLALGLTTRDGAMNKTGTAECAKVANWDAKGGVPATPVQAR